MAGGLYHRHKQTIFASLFAIALIGVAYYFRAQVVEHAANAALIVADSPRAVYQNKDTDGDGVPDWEENIRGTNPLVPNKPEDFASSTTPSADATADIPDNATSRFSKNFLADYMSRTADGSMSEAQKADFLKKALAEASVNAQDTQYGRGDIRISPVDDPASVRAYGNTLGAILMREQVANDNEIFITQRALQTESLDTLKELDPLILAYQHMVENVKMTSVPAPLINEHLALLNTLLALHNDIVGMRNIFDDGLPGIVRVRRYDTDVNAFSEALATLAHSLTENGAVYSETEPGVFFAQFATP